MPALASLQILNSIIPKPSDTLNGAKFYASREQLRKMSTHRQHGGIEHAVDGSRVASGVDGEARQLQDRRRRPHHHRIRLGRIAAFK